MAHLATLVTKRKKLRRKQEAKSHNQPVVMVKPLKAYPFHTLPQILQERLVDRQLETGHLYQYRVRHPRPGWSQALEKGIGTTVAGLLLVLYFRMLIAAGSAAILILIATALAVFIAVMLFSWFTDYYDDFVNRRRPKCRPADISGFKLASTIYITPHYIIDVRKQVVIYLPFSDISNLKSQQNVRFNPETHHYEVDGCRLSLKLKYRGEILSDSILVDYAPTNIAERQSQLVKMAIEDGSYAEQDDLAMTNQALMHAAKTN